MLPWLEIRDQVRTDTLPLEGDLFEELLASARLEDTGKGRRGGVLVKVDRADDVPLVRTTTRYGAPAQRFRPVHDRLAQQIQRRAGLSDGFNNALIEHYTDAYTTMGAHSDQALDLADGSHIAIYSCYKHPETARASRSLLIEPKEPGGEHVEIRLTHHSVVVFSLETNRRLRHKIVLNRSIATSENPWVGVTYRVSKTFVRYRDRQTTFSDGAPLTLASDEQRREFYRLRRRENTETDFTYPRITYTISESDRIPPDPA